MAVTWVRNAKIIVNPFDGVPETIAFVNQVTAAGISLSKETYTFPPTALDADIQSKIETDLTAKGYTI